MPDRHAAPVGDREARRRQRRTARSGHGRAVGCHRHAVHSRRKGKGAAGIAVAARHLLGDRQAAPRRVPVCDDGLCCGAGRHLHLRLRLGGRCRAVGAVQIGVVGLGHGIPAGGQAADRDVLQPAQPEAQRAGRSKGARLGRAVRIGQRIAAGGQLDRKGVCNGGGLGAVGVLLHGLCQLQAAAAHDRWLRLGAEPDLVEQVALPPIPACAGQCEKEEPA